MQWPKCTRRLVVFVRGEQKPSHKSACSTIATTACWSIRLKVASSIHSPVRGGPLCSSANAAGEFDHDLIHGEGLWSWPDGSSYVGQAKHGVREGKGLYVTAMKVSIEKQAR